MVLEIHQDLDLEVTKRHISINIHASKSPLTTNNRSRELGKASTKLVKSGKKSKNLPSRAPWMKEDKENIFRLSSLREKQVQTSTSNIESRVRPGDYQAKFQGISPSARSEKLRKRTALGSGNSRFQLSKDSTNSNTSQASRAFFLDEDFADSDMSLLTSPSAMGNPNDLTRSPCESDFQIEGIEARKATEVTHIQVENGTKLRGDKISMNASNYNQAVNQIIEDVPMLYCDKLAQELTLNFGQENIIGHSRSLPFQITSSTNILTELIFEVEKIPFTKGIDVAISDSYSDSWRGVSPLPKPGYCRGISRSMLITINSQDTAKLWVTWTPVEAGLVHDSIILKLLHGSTRLKVTILGKASDSKKEGRLSVVKPTANSDVALSCKQRFDNLFEATSIQGAHNITFPSTPGPNASKIKSKASISESWAEAQSLTFTEWLNYLFQPTEDSDNEFSMKKVENGQESLADINRGALRTLVFHQRLAQARARGIHVFRSEEMRSATTSIISEINRGRLSIRADRDLYSDLNLRGKVVSLLLSYSTQWLRIGLEVIFGEPIYAEVSISTSERKSTFALRKLGSTKSPQLTRMQQALRNVIVNRLLTDSATLRKFTKGRCNIPSGRFESQYRDEMRAVILQRLLVLVIFLDKAKMACILDRVPCLFTRSATVKSTKDVLFTLCREFMSSEGDVAKHLYRIGISISYKQEAIDEVDYRVSNLASDMRDGVRLARMVEILIKLPPKSLLSSLRLPAVSRLQKLHNVGFLLDLLASKGITASTLISPHHIVDGYREQVFQIIWAIVVHLEICSILDTNEVEEEIRRVSESNRSRVLSWNLKSITQQRCDTCFHVEDNSIKEQKIASVLLRWCNTVLSPYCTQVSDFSTSFADGIAMCLLIHHYHPSLLRLDEILATNRHGIPADRSILNERSNSILAAERMNELGGIPKILAEFDTKHPPQERTIFMCLAYLCSRLMVSSKEVLACIAIQLWYRRHKKLECLEKKITATKVIWKIWKDKRISYYRVQVQKYAWSVEKIESFFFKNKFKIENMRRLRLQKELMIRSAHVIQSKVRKWLWHLRIQPLMKQRRSAIVIQRQWKAWILRQYLKENQRRQISAVAIQSLWRSFHGSAHFSILRWGIIRLQGHVRGVQARCKLLKQSWAAIILQKIWRGFMAQVSLQIDILDIVTVQSLARRLLAQRLHLKRFTAVRLLQCFFRTHLSIRRMKIKKSALEQRHHNARMIQNMLRAQRVQISFQRGKAAEKIQKSFRMWMTRDKFKKMLVSCIIIQANMRRFITKSEYLSLKVIAIAAQSLWRRTWKRKQFRLSILSALKLQAHFRRYIVQCKLRRDKFCAMKIQRQWRSYFESKKFRLARGNLVQLQARVRTKLAIRVFKERLNSVIMIQTYFRMRRSQQLAFILRMHNFALVCDDVERIAATRVQSFVRKVQALRLANKVLEDTRRQEIASVLIQARFRRFQKGKLKLQQQRHAAVVLQSFFRMLTALYLIQKRKRAILNLQRLTRGYLLRSQIKYSCCSATSIQSYWRVFKIRKLYIAKKSSIIMAQATIRSCLAKRKAKMLRKSIAVLQGFGRRVTTERQNRKMKLANAALQLQKTYRGFRIRCNMYSLYRAARKLQSFWRMVRCRKMFKETLHRIVSSQAIARRIIAYRLSREKLDSILVIQGFIRVVLAKAEGRQKKAERDRRLRMEASAVHLQRMLRGFRTRKILRRKENASKVIQKNFRMYKALIERRITLTHITLVQSLVRLRQASNSIPKKLSAISRIQHAARQWIDCKRAKATLSELKKQRQALTIATVKLQSFYRRFKEIELLKRITAATKIQKTWRCYVCHVDFVVVMFEILCIQRCARTYLHRCRQQRRFNCAILIQAKFRAIIARQLYLKYMRSIIRLQASCRGRCIRKNLKLSGDAANAIQHMFRQYVAQKKRECFRLAAIEVQRVYRGSLAKKNVKLQISKIFCLQRAIRCFLARQNLQRMRRERRARNYYKESRIKLIQQVFRQHREFRIKSKAAFTIQRAIKASWIRLRERRFIFAVVQIQALARANRIRRGLTKAKRLIYLRVVAANERAKKNPSMVLGVRTQRALRELQTSKRLTEIMEAAKVLETSTRLSIKCCFAFVEIGAPNILYSLIGTCNRSLPHIEILYFVLLTLYNVSQHKKLLGEICSTKGADLFLDLVQMLRERKEILGVALTLLSRVVKHDERCTKICSKPENIKRLNHVLKKISSTENQTNRLARDKHSLNAKRFKDPVKVLRGLLAHLNGTE